MKRASFGAAAEAAFEDGHGECAEFDAIAEAHLG